MRILIAVALALPIIAIALPFFLAGFTFQFMRIGFLSGMVACLNFNTWVDARFPKEKGTQNEL